MSWLVPIVSVVGSLIILTLVVIIFYLKYKEEELPRNITKIWNLMPHYAENRAEGLLKDITKGEKRSLVEYFPGDVNFMNQSDSFKPTKTVVENKKIVPLARGTHSKDVDILLLLPPFPEDLPYEFQKTYFGKLVMDAIERINEDNVVESILRERLSNTDKVRKKFDTGGIFTNALEELENISRDQLRVISKEKGKSHEGGSTGMGYPTGGPPKM